MSIAKLYLQSNEDERLELDEAMYQTAQLAIRMREINAKKPAADFSGCLGLMMQKDSAEEGRFARHNTIRFFE